MRFNPLEIPLEGKKFAFDLKEEDLTRLTEQVEIVKISCIVSVKGIQERMRLQTEYHAQLIKPCDLCLKQTSLALDGDFPLTLLPSYMDNQPLGGEGEITSEMADIDYYNGNEINLAPFIEDQLILEIPFRTICKDDCKGLCPTCGLNLNDTSCECTESSITRPFANLKNLISNQKQE